MKIAYQFPTIIFHGEMGDPETAEIVYQDAEIHLKHSRKAPHEAKLLAEGYHFHILIGATHRNTYYLCIPDRTCGFELSTLKDPETVIDTMYWFSDHLDYEEICVIAYGLKNITPYLKKKKKKGDKKSEPQS